MVVEALLAQSLGPLGPTNFLKHAIQFTYQSGVPWGTIVVLLLFPFVAALIAGARYFVGIKGFGIFTPAMLAVAFMVTGIIQGIVLFLLILAVATAARMALKKLKIHYLARMSLLLWFICLTVFANLFWMKVSIFPILILILLAENFIEVQIGKSLAEASQMTIETLILALGSLALLEWAWLRQLVLTQPELVVLGTFIFNLVIGRFTGLRLLEYRRFRKIIK